MDTPEEIIRGSLQPRRWARMEAVLSARLGAVRVVVENLHHPHNLSAVLRTCEGLGVQHVHMVETVENCTPSRRISRGAHKWLTVHRHDSFDACAALLHGLGFRLYAAMLDHGALPLAEVPVDLPVAVVFGNEKDGVAPATRALCDGAYMIPMTGFVQSFNVSVAAAVTLYGLTERVRAQREDGGLLSPDERARVLASWLPKSLRCGRKIKRAGREATRG